MADVEENSGKTGDKRYNELFNECWSIFFPVWIIKYALTCGGRYQGIGFKISYWIILIILSTSVLLPIWSGVNNLFICYRDYFRVVSSIRNLCGAVTVFAMLCVAKFGINCPKSNTYCPDCYYEITKHVDQMEDGEENRFHDPCCKCNKFLYYIFNMLWNLLYTWIFLIATSVYLTFIIPILNPNINHIDSYNMVDWTILIADFVLTLIRLYHTQLYLIICDRLCKKIKCQLEPIVCNLKRLVSNSTGRKFSDQSIGEDMNEEWFNDDQDVEIQNNDEHDTALGRINRHICSEVCKQKGDHYNLTKMVMKCMSLRRIVSTIDQKISWFTFFGTIEFIFGVSAPFLQLLHAFKKEEISPTLAIVYYSPWIVFRFVLFFYSLYKTYKIANTYKTYVNSYRGIFCTRLFCSECPLLKKEYTYANEKIFKKTPSLSLGGFMAVGSPPVCTLIAGIKIFLSFGVLPVILKNIYDYQLPTSVMYYYFTHCVDFRLPLNESQDVSDSFIYNYE